MAVRLRRSELVQRNRSAVLEAARRVFIERGYTGATLEAIAGEAGFSKGVMYSQFASKPDLLLTLLEERIEERARENERIAAHRSGSEGLRAILETAINHAVNDAAWALLLIEFRAIAARDLDVSRRYAELDRRTVQLLANVLQQFFGEAAITPPFAIEAVAQFILALDSGIALERASNPSAVPSDVVAAFVLRALGFDGAPKAPPARARQRRAADRNR